MKSFGNASRGLMRSRAAIRTAVTGLIVVGALTFGLISAGGAANGKYYTAGINPSSVGAGSSQSYTLTITNDPSSGSNTVGSANITVPSGFSVTSPTVTTSPAPKQWSATLNNGVIELRSGQQSTNALANNQSVSVAFTAAAPCATGSYQWTTVVKQSNDFKGTDASNIFRIKGAYPTVTVASGSGTKLVFTTAAQTFTVPGPSGTITVQRLNDCGAPATQGSLAVGLASTSTAGSFSPASLTIADTSSYASFTYYDTLAYTLVGGVKTPPATPTITASASGLTSAMQQETVNPQTDVNDLVFTTQPPAWVLKDTQFTVGVTAYDQYGNPVKNHAVSIELGNNPNAATLTCDPISCSASTNDVGTATFTLKLDKDSVGYTLVARGSNPGTSNGFNVADQIADCQGSGNCSPTGSDGSGTTTNSNVSNFTGQAAVAVDGSLEARLDLCGGSLLKVGSGTVFEAVNSGTGSTPSWTITMRVAKSALVDPARGAALYDVCLGTVNLSKTTPYVGLERDQPACASSTDYSWPAKGGCAKYDGTKNFWGNVPDASPSVKKCSQALSPVVLSKNKTQSGDLVITFCAPYPWDGAGGFH